MNASFSHGRPGPGFGRPPMMGGNDRFGFGWGLPFIGGALVGGLLTSNRPQQQYYSYPQVIYPMYPTYPQYPIYYPYTVR